MIEGRKLASRFAPGRFYFSNKPKLRIYHHMPDQGYLQVQSNIMHPSRDV